MVYVRKIYIGLIILLGFSINSYSESEISGKKVLFGPVIGRTTSHGYYNDQLNSGYSFGIFVNYSFFNNPYLLFEGNFLYTELSLENSSKSEFSVYTAGAGPVILIPFRYIQPYMGFFATFNYFNLNTVVTGRDEKTYKAGAAVKAGMNFPVYKNFCANIGVRYSINELSGEVYHASTFYAGITYSLNFFTREKVQSITRQIEIDEYYETGLTYFQKGDGVKAKEYFETVLEYDKSYKNAEHYIEIIRTSELNYDKALRLISEDKLFEALPLLVDTEKYLIKASLKLTEIREQIVGEEKKLENLGIQAYDHEEYEKCIYYMKRVQLINPDNESIKIYLPRAIQRYNALKKFE